ncbi:MAG: hypothetical protein LBP39_00605, partial [Rickettsiales bacterium]|nr:hypothetical protein [Rickettsiales bacterium]
EKLGILPKQPVKTNLETVSAKRKRETDFSYRVRLDDEQDRAVKVLREDPKKSEKVILKELEAQRNFLTQNGRKRGVDDNVVNYGRRRNKPDTFVRNLMRDGKRRSTDDTVVDYGKKSEFGTFVSREEKKKNEKNIAI